MSKPVVKLTGLDGNVFSVISEVCKGLRVAGFTSEASEFTQKAFDCESYDEVLRLAFEYVEVT